VVLLMITLMVVAVAGHILGLEFILGRTQAERDHHSQESTGRKVGGPPW
jgi:type II secretory pathway component PulK